MAKILCLCNFLKIVCEGSGLDFGIFIVQFLVFPSVYNEQRQRCCQVDIFYWLFMSFYDFTNWKHTHPVRLALDKSSWRNSIVHSRKEQWNFTPLTNKHQYTLPLTLYLQSCSGRAWGRCHWVPAGGDSSAGTGGQYWDCYRGQPCWIPSATCMDCWLLSYSHGTQV